MLALNPLRIKGVIIMNTGEKNIELNPELIISKLNSWADLITENIPNVLLALFILLTFFILSNIIKKLALHYSAKYNRSNLGEILAGLLYTITLIFGSILSITTIVPSMDFASLLSGLGIGSVAIGFAFKDFLQNWFAGLFILIRRPFKVGDTITTQSYEGIVEHIEARVTVLRVKEGQKALIPNAKIYKESLLVNERVG